MCHKNYDIYTKCSYFSATLKSFQARPGTDNESNADMFSDGDELRVSPDNKFTESLPQLMVINQF